VSQSIQVSWQIDVYGTQKVPAHPKTGTSSLALLLLLISRATEDFDQQISALSKPDINEKCVLYYEDVDIGAFLWKAHRRVVACPQVTVVHNAQRASRRDLRHMRWHLQSMTRYFRKHLFRLPVAK